MSENGLNILLIADVGVQSQHSSVEGLFKSRKSLAVHCRKIFFDKGVKIPQSKPDRLILPYKYRRHGLVQALAKYEAIKHYDVIIVRNFFSVLGQILKADLPVSVGFWESFPHSRRRLDQALHENRAVLRKRLEYFWAKRREQQLIQRCNFYLPITETHKSVYYPDLTIPSFPTPMGFDFERYPIKPRRPASGPLRFVYIGAIDELRRFDLINNAFLSQKDDFVLDYFSSQKNESVESIKQIQDPRIRFRGALPRTELFAEIATADIGICFFPHTKTYITASPTKTLEYGALGLTVLVNPMPEYQALLDDSCAFLCEFEETAIREKIEAILAKDRSVLTEMGRRLQQRVLQQRSYEKMAERLFAFIRENCRQDKRFTS